MLKFFLQSLIIFALASSCVKKDSSKLEKLSREDILELHKAGQWNLKYAIFLNEKSSEANLSDIERFNNGLVSADYYMDKNQVIKKVILRPTSYKDKITYILIKNLDYNPSNGVPYIDINCDSLDLESKIDSLFAIEDDFSGLDKMVTDTMGFFDRKRMVLVSIEKKCGLPYRDKYGKKVVKLFWSIIHHNEKEVMVYYYSYIENLVELGHLHPEKLALTTDRILMEFGFPQVYGSQMMNFKLYPIENPGSVDFRRAEIGLEPLSEYLKNFDL